MLKQLRLIFLLSRPLFVLGGVLVYGLGVGIARYLGAAIDWELYFLGQAYVTSMQLSAQYLNEYFDAPADKENKNQTPFTGGSGVIGEGKLSRETAMWAALTALTVLASLTVVLISVVQLSPLLIIIIILAFMGSFFYSTPPVRLANTGYGELTTSILVANLVPIFAFLLQYGEMHRLLVMTTFSLTALHLAMMIVFEFPDYLNDLKFDKYNLLVRVGWEKGMVMHNLLILTAFLLLGLAATFGLPLAIALPAFIPLPLGLLQIWQMRRIAGGSKPNWSTMSFTAVVLFGSVAYLLAFTFWTR
ncbi:MAG: prenyltransferase [Anaerolineales bacterium]|jgi:1,4-dihydroxy-2-naphthoate octaprenyltransferase